MFEAICYGLVSLLAGGLASLFAFPEWGPVVSISVIGVGVINALNKRKD